jgi:hypothetical protein
VRTIKQHTIALVVDRAFDERYRKQTALITALSLHMVHNNNALQLELQGIVKP